MRRPTLSYLRGFLNPWVILGSGILGAGLFAALLALGVILRPAPQPKSAPTAAVNVIVAPTITPILPTPTLNLTATPEAPLPPPPLPGVLAIGSYVQITGTGASGLRLRSQPGLEGTVDFIGLENEIFRITDGPNEADGYTWWYLTAPYDEKRHGWAASNYLTISQNP
jgi:hypothetical protein